MACWQWRRRHSPLQATCWCHATNQTHDLIERTTTMTQYTPKLFVLEASGRGRLFSINPDGSGKTVIVTGCPVPDGVAVDVEAGHIYWTNMGNPSANDGSIERVDLDGANLKHIVPPGGTHTPKQLQFDKKNGKLYWCDREGMRVMRVNIDGSNLETLVDPSQG